MSSRTLDAEILPEPVLPWRLAGSPLHRRVVSIVTVMKNHRPRMELSRWYRMTENQIPIVYQNFTRVFPKPVATIIVCAHGLGEVEKHQIVAKQHKQNNKTNPQQQKRNKKKPKTNMSH